MVVPKPLLKLALYLLIYPLAVVRPMQRGMIDLLLPKHFWPHMTRVVYVVVNVCNVYAQSNSVYK